MNRKTLGLAAGALVAAIAVPGLAQAQSAFTTDLVNLRAGPGYDYPVVFAIQPNQPLVSHGCLGDWSWCDVSFNGYRGWMAGQYIVYAYDNRNVPVIEYGPRYNVPVVTFDFDTYWDSYYRGRPWYSERTRWHDYYRGHPPTYQARRHDDDHDGIANRYDRDRDGDGIPNRYDRDRDGDGIPNWRDHRD